MRRAGVVVVVAVVVGVVLALTLTGGGSLAIEQRVLRDGEFAGFVAPAHVSVARDVGAFLRGVPASQATADVRRLRRAGFVAAITEHLRSTVTPVDRDAISTVVQFRRVDSARAEVTHALAGEGAHLTAFAAPAIPGAKGLARSRGYGRSLDIAFANGRFFYLVGCAFDARSKRPPTRSQLIAAAQLLYRRVH
ncbi:MAG: hypothetical protein ACXVHQ_40290 [Solirubrobacteraceae bacterium]|jgi:hypothetical protein